MKLEKSILDFEKVKSAFNETSDCVVWPGS